MDCAWRVGRVARLTAVFVAAAVLAGGRRHATAQLGRGPESGRFELAERVQLDLAEATVLADLKRVDAHLEARQWDDAVATLRGVLDSAEDELVDVAEHKLADVPRGRYVSLRDYCHLRLGGLPAEALTLYRSQVDPMARRWYEQGVAGRDRRLLAKVLEQAFASSFGDDALMALGEIALEEGDYTSARWHWERIVPVDRPPEAPRTWPGFPDTDLDLAAVRARLVLVSILEGSLERAREELARFAQLHGDARGRLAGQDGVHYVEALRALLAESGEWPPRKPTGDWPTFAGNALRNKAAPEMIDVAGVAWRIALGQPEASPGFRSSRESRHRGLDLVAEDAHAPLSYHPVLVGNLVLVNNHREILAVEARTGKPAWGPAGGAIYRAQLEGAAGVPPDRFFAVGTVPRYTLTVVGNKLYARMPSFVADRTVDPDRRPVPPGYLVCLDLAAEGRLDWKIRPAEGWAFEGSPVADQANVYVAMRRSEVRPQAYVACFDARTGHRRWRRFVCGAETTAYRMRNTHNLLTLRQKTIYYNTNLGAVAAISARDGRIHWVSLYPRARYGNLSELAPHWHRDLNPCLFDRGRLLVAPADSPRIFAFDAATGQMLWRSGTQVDDVVHLLGSTEDHLIASGHKLYWIGLKGEGKGRVEHVWPDGPDKLGYGRGLLAAECVLWPTRQQVYVFDQKGPPPKKVIRLARRGAGGGNLLVADGRLLIATATELVAMSPHGGGPQEKTDKVVVNDTTKGNSSRYTDGGHWAATRPGTTDPNTSHWGAAMAGPQRGPGETPERRALRAALRPGYFPLGK